MLRFGTLAALLTPVLLVACDPAASARPDDPRESPSSTVSATVVATDVSRPSTGSGSPAAVTGTVTLSDVSVELWNGDAWVSVGGATFADLSMPIGDVGAEATLVAGIDIAADTYTRARLTATAAVLDLSLNVGGQALATVIASPPDEPVMIEKDVDVDVHGDGTITVHIEIESVRSVTVEVEPGTGAAVVTIDGDVMGATAALAVMAEVVIGDVSTPAAFASVGGTVTGSVDLSGVAVELWNGVEWVTLVDPAGGTATIAVGDGAATATLVPATEIAAGTYTKARITVADAVVSLSLTINGDEYTAQIELPTDVPIVIEKEIEVTVNEDGSLTLSIAIQAVQSISVQVDPGSGAAEVTIDGDLGGGSVTAGVS